MVTLAGYALVLYTLPDLPLWIPSYVYHIVILAFPLVLVAYGRESAGSLGLKWGRWKFGIPAALVVIAISFLIWWFINRRFFTPAIDHVLLATVIWGPAAEEILFRGFLQPKLESE